MTGFPARRLRRLRDSEAVRALVRETRVSADDLVQPIFVVENPAAAGPIQALPGIERHSLDSLDAEIDRISSAGIRAVLVFGIPADKDSTGASATKPDGIVPAACTPDQGAASRPAGDHRRVLVQLYGSRPLRCIRQRAHR